MSFGLSHIGATPRSPAYAAAPAARLDGAAAPAEDRFQVSAVRPVPPATGAAEAREQIRHQVMAERGVDLFILYRMSAQARLQAEVSIAAETASRARQTQVRESANFLDLRV